MPVSDLSLPLLMHGGGSYASLSVCLSACRHHTLKRTASFVLSFSVKRIHQNQPSAMQLAGQVAALQLTVFATQHSTSILYHRMTFYSIVGGVFEQPFKVGIQVRGLLEENKSDLVYSGSIHNRSRILRCSKVRFHFFLGGNYLKSNVIFFDLLRCSHLCWAVSMAISSSGQDTDSFLRFSCISVVYSGLILIH